MNNLGVLNCEIADKIKVVYSNKLIYKLILFLMHVVVELCKIKLSSPQLVTKLCFYSS